MRRRSTEGVVWFAIGLLGALLAGCTGDTVVGGGDAGGMDAPDIGPSCTSTQTLCGSRCAELQSDPANCGACGRSCAAGMVCTAGTCQVQCPAGATVCGGTCVNTQTDNANCGACGRACTAGQVCSLGACGTTCAASLATCAGGDAGSDAGAAPFCADLANDRLNCGACGNACPPGNICVGRACVLSCSAGQSACSGACVDLQSSNAHCGACGNACAAGTTCAAGACVVSCAAGLTQCGSTCVNVQTDNANCGACGTACAAGQVCSAGACGATCASPLTTCTGGAGSFCANTRLDPANCGACGTACSLPNAAAHACADGMCGVARCAANYGDCDGAAANGCETDTRTTVTHCGGCGRACALPHATAGCAAGACTVTACATGYADCDNDPSNGCEVDTRTDNGHCGTCPTACGAGQVCSNGSCGATCAPPLATCTAAGGSAACANTQNDPSNCGGCNTACALANVAVQSCAAGACAVAGCAANFGNCDGVAANGCETDVRTASAHCGACGRACALPNATSACAAGACGVTACAAGYANCDSVAANGCEVSTASDNANCGGCGNACPSGQVCSAGACVATCASPLTLCGGGCVNTTNDPTHCGSCAGVCPTPAHAVPVCAAGACAFVCAAGYGDCDRNAANGCEVDLTNTVASCGSCTGACPARTGATPTCAASTCGFTCNAGSANCDGMAANGCEVNTNTPANCGGCGNVCPTYANSTPTCATGTCGISCATGFGDCDGIASNGCSSLQSDAANCGACGRVCGAGLPCNAGVCLDPASCRTIKMTNPSATDGVYRVDPDGAGSGAPFDVYCDMTTDGGGWTVMAYIRSEPQWDIMTYANSGTVGNTTAGFASGATMRASAGTFTERIIIYRHLVEGSTDLGQQWMVTYRADGVAVPYSNYDSSSGWSYRDSFGFADATVSNVCTHGCNSYRGLGMFHDYESGFGYAGTQTGNYGCRDGNNICWMPRSLGCNVGDARCSLLTGPGEGVVYAAR